MYLPRDEARIDQLSRRLLRAEVFERAREFRIERILVALNMGPDPEPLAFPQGTADGRLLLSTFLDRADEPIADSVDLRGNEGVVVAL